MRYTDTAECNIPMAGARGRRLDAEITRNVAAQRREEGAQSRVLRAEFKAEKEEAKRLYAEFGERLVEAYGAKFGPRALRIMLSDMAKTNPRRFVMVVKKFQAERAAA